MQLNKMEQGEIADKRVAVTPSTWVALHGLKEPGKSLGDMIADLVTEHQRRMLEMDLDEIDRKGHFVPWDQAKKELGLQRGSVQIHIEEDVKDFIRHLPEKDRRVIGEYIEHLTDHPNDQGNIKKLKTQKPRWRMHVSSKYAIFYYVSDDMVFVNPIMSQELAHKKYGKI